MSGYRLLGHVQSLCNPVLRDAKAIHAEYLDVEANLGYGANIGYV